MSDATTDIEKARRKHTRLALEVKAIITLTNDHCFEGLTKDMSFGGAFVNLDSSSEGQIPVGEECELELQLGAAGKPLKVIIESRVVRAGNGGIGLEFCATTIEGYWHFKNLMVYNSPEAETLLTELETHPGLVIEKNSE